MRAAVTARLEPWVQGLESPVLATHAGDGSGRLFIVEQGGQILVCESNGTLRETPFLDLSAAIDQLSVLSIGGNTNRGLNPIYDERGLLGLAFHPEYAENGRFFVHYSSPKSGAGTNHESVVAEFHVSSGDQNLADPTGTNILVQWQPEFNHNAGALEFGPDGNLYIAFGDGGGAGDVHGASGNGQNISNLFGTIVRIDVDARFPDGIPPDNPFVGREGRDEIFAYGFRNPFRMSFDPGNSNRFFVADVGQNIYEEINLVRKGGNYGWRVVEGLHAFDLPVANSLGLNVHEFEYPIHEYSHAEAGISVIGGYVYRGTHMPALSGAYVFGDFSTSFPEADGHLYYLAETRSNLWERFAFNLAPSNAPFGEYVKGFGVDAQGELYVLSSTTLGPSGTNATLYRLVAP